MTTPPPRDPIDQTDDYLEWLAGHGDKEPQLDPADQDILKSTRLLGTLCAHDPRPALVPKIKHAVLATSQHVAPVRPTQPHGFNALSLWKIGAPVLALGVVLVAVLVTRPIPVTNHAGTGFIKTTVTTTPPVTVVELSASEEDALGVDMATNFVLKATAGQVTLAEVQKNFNLNPAIDFTVTAKDAATYEITPKQKLTPGAVYAATYQVAPTDVDSVVQPRVYSWAYQVRDTFRIIGWLPRDQATAVSENTGIEVTFSSAGVTAEEFQKNFKIEPAVTGRVETHQRTMVFIPDKALDEKTVYTVTVKAGLKPAETESALAVDQTIRFETAAKNTKDSQDFYSSFFPSQLFESVRPNEPLVFSNGSGVYGSNTKPSTKQFIVYQYPDLAAFIKAMDGQESSRSSWAVFGAQGDRYVTDGLKKVGAYKTVETKDGIITLGPGFSQGFYLADGGTGKDQAQIPFVVSNVGSYSITTKTDSLVWAHDLVTKKPIAGAAVTIPGTAVSATTGADGVARFGTPSVDASKTIIGVLDTGTVQTPILLNGSRSGAFFGRLTQNSDYWSFLSTDRGLYQPTDTVQFWGLLRHRDDPKPTEKITAQIVQRTFEGRYETQVITSVDLTTSPTGTYLGSLNLRGIAPNTSTELDILVDGEIVLNRYLSVETYRKPPFRITITPNHVAAIAGEEIQFNIVSQFFDGTPVPNLALKSAYSGDAKTLVTTNAQGKAVYKMKMSENNNALSLAPTDDQLQAVTGSSYVQVFPAALEITAATSLKDTTGTLTGTVVELHPEKAQVTEADPLANVRGPVKPNQKVEGKMIEIIYEKTQIGTHYDYLLKEMIADYQYTNKDEVRETFTLTTDAKGAFKKTFTVAATSVYRIDLITVDAKNREAKTSAYFWHSLYNGIYSGTQYTLTDVTQRDGDPVVTYPIGGQVTLQAQLNGALAAIPPDGSMLYLLSQRGLRRYAVSNSPIYSFSFGESDVPSISSRAVIFTGVGYAEMYGPTAQFDSTTRKLNINLTADKSTYDPGDRVRLTVKATDQKNQGQVARINIKAIDEAFLSLTSDEDSYITPNTIYQSIDDGVIGTYVSHQAIASRALAEGGGGGGDRTDFRDTAIFTEITTDAQGNGSLDFKLPDNLTSWRVTAQGFTDSLLAGKTKMAVTVSKDVFVTVAVEPDQLSRDQTTVVAGTFGRILTDQDGVAYAFSLPDVPGTETTLSGKAFTTTRFAMPRLQPGAYAVRVATEAKGKNDAVVSRVAVSASRLQRRTVKSLLLPSTSPPMYANDGRTTFRFDDADRNLAYTTLWNLVGASYNRLDDVVADQAAHRLLNETFTETLGGASTDPSIFLTGKGLGLYVIGSENLEYGALAASDQSLSAARQQLLNWFQGTLDDPKQNTEQVAYALYGLAQLDQPVLTEIRTLLAAQELTDRDRLTLLLALEALGAKEEARKPALAMIQKYGEVQDTYFRLSLGESDDEKIVNSARFAILAAGLGLEQRYGLLNYLQNYPPKDTRTTLEQALATTRLLALAPETAATVTYSLEGTPSTATLTAAKPLMINLDAAQAKTLQVTNVTGQVSLVTTYQEPFDVTKANRDDHLSVTRTYLVNNKKTTTFTTGDIVKVQFTWTKKNGGLGQNFGITDLLPTGLRPVSNPWAFTREQAQTVPYAIEGQRVQLYAGSKGVTFFYLARASAPGKTVAEPAILQAFDAPSSIQYSNEAVVEIK